MEQDAKKRLAEVESWLQAEYATIRTGQATPALLDAIKVQSYGSYMTIQQVASIGIEDARTLRVAPWDVSVIKDIERALQEADLGVSVATDSAGIRVIFPELSAERRVQLTKLAKSKMEDARIRVRAIRDEIMKALDKRQKDGEISEDQKFRDKEAVQKVVDAANSSLESLLSKKEAELQK